MMPAKRLWKRRLSARCKRFESFASVAFGEADGTKQDESADHRADLL